MTDNGFPEPRGEPDVYGTLERAAALAVGIAPMVAFLNGWVAFETAVVVYLAATALLLNGIYERLS